MSLIFQNPLSNATYRVKFYSPKNTTHLNSTKTLKFSLFHNQSLQNNDYPFHKNLSLLRNRLSLIKVHDSSINAFQEEDNSIQLFNLDGFLSFLESICVISAVLISVGCWGYRVFYKQHTSGLLAVGSRLLVWLLAVAVAVGSVIRRRQWKRVCGSPMNSRPGSETGNVIDRIEKLEESMRSATSIIRMLSRQLEKLGVRFRVTRKSLKDPISETAALTQKNSEATRALAVQESILEKELGEVQKVLLAMQDQQQKQLELILAIAKSGKLFETKQSPSQTSVNKTVPDNGLKQVDGQQIQATAVQTGASNDRASGS
ncbi:uncharacterized protein LOC110682236 [Chenopodium quinoa]|nr:uncharacterized protein LOC110682236 [Chenopodium quinoa]